MGEVRGQAAGCSLGKCTADTVRMHTAEIKPQSAGAFKPAGNFLR